MNHAVHKPDWPFVSVIIPFYNNQNEVIRIEEALRHQSYPANQTEFIFIDNGSDNLLSFPESFLSRNILLEENKHPNSPYSARNRGIEESIGEGIVFVDANSIPEETWLENGVSSLLNFDSDLVGGNVQFDFQGKITAGKIVDALTSINMEKAIHERGAAYTANLFVKREVFEKVGLFEEGVRSGGDVRWTFKAKEHGFTITYCEDAVVSKYARSVKALYRKKIRTGKGYYHTWKGEPERRIWFYNFFRSLKPPTLSKIRKLNPGRYEAKFDNYLIGVWFHLYVSGIVQQVSFIFEYLRIILKK